MPTPAERKALLFLAGVIVLGASVRVVRAARDDREPAASSREALARQLAAVDSASDAARTRAPGGRPRARGSSRRPSHSGRSRDSAGPSAAPPAGGTPISGRRAGAPDSMPPPVIDLDVAGASEIETLPRIGPVLARRIVDDRARNGPFGSLEAFQRVRGVGPAMVAALAPRVTFSGTARPSNAVVDPRLRTSSPPLQSLRRKRRKTPT